MTGKIMKWVVLVGLTLGIVLASIVFKRFNEWNATRLIYPGATQHRPDGLYPVHDWDIICDQEIYPQFPGFFQATDARP